MAPEQQHITKTMICQPFVPQCWSRRIVTHSNINLNLCPTDVALSSPTLPAAEGSLSCRMENLESWSCKDPQVQPVAQSTSSANTRIFFNGLERTCAAECCCLEKPFKMLKNDKQIVLTALSLTALQSCCVSVIVLSTNQDSL